MRHFIKSKLIDQRRLHEDVSTWTGADRIGRLQEKSADLKSEEAHS